MKPRFKPTPLTSELSLVLPEGDLTKEQEGGPAGRALQQAKAGSNVLCRGWEHLGVSWEHKGADRVCLHGEWCRQLGGAWELWWMDSFVLTMVFGGVSG